MAATLVVTLRDVTLHDAGHYFLTVQYLTADGYEKKVRTEVSSKTSAPEFKNCSFSLPIKATDGVLLDAELQFGAFVVMRSELQAAEAASKGTAKLAGLCAKQLADLAPALARGPMSESIVLSHPEGAAVGSLVADLRVEMGPGDAPLRASPEQLDGGAFEVVVRSAFNLDLLTGKPDAASAGAGGLVLAVSAVCRGVATGELARTRPSLAGALAAWNETLVVRPRAPILEAEDGLTLSLLPAQPGTHGGAGGGNSHGGGSGDRAALARVHVPLAGLRDEAPRELRLELAEGAGAVLHVGFRRLPPALPTGARLEMSVRQLRPAAGGLSVPPAGSVSVMHFFRTLSDYAPASLPWRHAYVPPAPAAIAALRRIAAAPPALANARSVTWARDGGDWPQACQWSLTGASDAPPAGSGCVLEIYFPELLMAAGSGAGSGSGMETGAEGADGCEWRLWAHATLPMPAEVQRAGSGAQQLVDVPFEAPLVLARAAAALPGSEQPPLIAGSLRWLPPAPRAHEPAPAPSPGQGEYGDTRGFARTLSPVHGGEGEGNGFVQSQQGQLQQGQSQAQQAQWQWQGQSQPPSAHLVAELEQKQALINRLLREVDARTAALSRCGAELVSLRDKYAELERAQRATLAELRERDSALERLALDAGQAEHLDARELARRHRMLGGAYRAEKSRSDALASQLALLTERADSARRLEAAYVALQGAHRAQAAELQQAQADAAALPKYRRAVKSQERLIAKLESLVRPALREQRASREALAEGAAMRARLAELEARQAESAAIGTEEHVKLVMRAEQAERRAMATEEELSGTARNYAREIAALKVKLAEKEAELLGRSSAGLQSPAGRERASKPANLRSSASRPPSSGSARGNGGIRRGSGAQLEALAPRTPAEPRARSGSYSGSVGLGGGGGGGEARTAELEYTRSRPRTPQGLPSLSLASGGGAEEPFDGSHYNF